MSREIEFRGLKPNGEFVYGYYVEGMFDGTSSIVDFGIAKKGCYPEAVKQETVGQFTGLLDCNGVKIFEGDIVHFELDDFDIYFEVLIDGSGRFVARNHLQENDFYFLDDFEYTIFGNIHQNSELLK